MSEPMEGIQRRLSAGVKIWVLLVAVAAALIVGGLAVGIFSAGGRQQATAEPGVQWWTCSMHPWIQLPGPGRCPICDMPLVPRDTQKSESGSLRELTVSESARGLMAIETSPVERKFVEARVPMTGKIDYDESLLKYITAWVPGRLDRLYVDYTGVPVAEGDHMVELYSPDLLSAQEELLQALQAVRGLEDSDIGIVRQMTEDTVQAAREKLRLWGLKPEQIADIERRGEVSDHITIYAPIGGIVIHKNAQQGMYVQTGTRIYTIADLSRVWVRLDAYESDLQWLRFGQKVKLTTEAYPGEEFDGTIAFIDPVLTEATRTVKIRVNAANPEMKLKPGMFVRAVAEAEVASGGMVMDKSLAGKWICPMHPDVVRDSAGECSICQMPLVPTESLGYVSVDLAQVEKPLVIPVTAALITGGRSAGSRAIVYVQVDPSLLTTRGVYDWGKLLAAVRDAALSDAAAGPMARLLGLLSVDLREKLLAVGADDMPDGPLQNQFVREINEMLRGGELYDESTWRGVALGGEATGLIARGPDDLPEYDRTRLNRLLLESIFPASVVLARSGAAFEGREVVLGPRAGDYYIVRRGLNEGERVVTRGNFKIDAELQIQARPAMMTPEGGAAGGGGAHQARGEHADGTQQPADAGQVQLSAETRLQLSAVMATAEDVNEAVHSGSLDEAALAFGTLGEKVRAVRKDALTGRAQLLWKEYDMLLGNDAVDGEAAHTLDQAKRVAELMNEHIASMASKLGILTGNSAGSPLSEEFRRQLQLVVASYLLVHEALFDDDAALVASASRQGVEAMNAVDMKLLTGEAHMAWMESSPTLMSLFTDISKAGFISLARESFASVSQQLIEILRRLGAPGETLYVFHCPMAFDGRGANWVQADQETRNPYFGAAMPTCGEVTEVLFGASDDGDANE